MLCFDSGANMEQVDSDDNMSSYRQDHDSK